MKLVLLLDMSVFIRMTHSLIVSLSQQERITKIESEKDKKIADLESLNCDLMNNIAVLTL